MHDIPRKEQDIPEEWKLYAAVFRLYRDYPNGGKFLDRETGHIRHSYEQTHEEKLAVSDLILEGPSAIERN